MTSGQAISKLKHDKKYTDDVIRPLEKEHKALEIINRKKVNVGDELFVLDKATDEWVFDTYEGYLKSVRMIPNKYHLTQDEFDLLKEALS